MNKRIISLTREITPKLESKIPEYHKKPVGLSEFRHHGLSYCAAQSNLAKPQVKELKFAYREILERYINNLKNKYSNNPQMLSNKLEEFILKAEKIPSSFSNIGEYHLANVLYVELLKLPEQTSKIYKQLLDKALETAKQSNDKPQILGKLGNLENYYKASKDKISFINILKQKIECCKWIIENFDEARKTNFRLGKDPFPKKESFETTMSFAQESLKRMQ